MRICTLFIYFNCCRMDVGAHFFLWSLWRPFLCYIALVLLCCLIDSGHWSGSRGEEMQSLFGSPVICRWRDNASMSLFWIGINDKEVGLYFFTRLLEICLILSLYCSGNLLFILFYFNAAWVWFLYLYYQYNVVAVLTVSSSLLFY